jgi:hypothetical protein
MGPMIKQEPSLAPHFWNVPYLVGFMHGKAWGLKTSVGQCSLWLWEPPVPIMMNWIRNESNFQNMINQIDFFNFRTWPKIESFFLSQTGCRSRFLIRFTKTVLIYLLEPELGFLIMGYEKFAQVVVFFITDPEMLGFIECDV